MCLLFGNSSETAELHIRMRTLEWISWSKAFHHVFLLSQKALLWCITSRERLSAGFDSTCTVMGTLQRRLSGAMCKDDMQICTAFYLKPIVSCFPQPHPSSYSWLSSSLSGSTTSLITVLIGQNKYTNRTNTERCRQQKYLLFAKILLKSCPVTDRNINSSDVWKSSLIMPMKCLKTPLSISDYSKHTDCYDILHAGDPEGISCMQGNMLACWAEAAAGWWATHTMRAWHQGSGRQSFMTQMLHLCRNGLL